MDDAELEAFGAEARAAVAHMLATVEGASVERGQCGQSDGAAGGAGGAGEASRAGEVAGVLGGSGPVESAVMRCQRTCARLHSFQWREKLTTGFCWMGIRGGVFASGSWRSPQSHDVRAFLFCPLPPVSILPLPHHHLVLTRVIGHERDRILGFECHRAAARVAGESGRRSENGDDGGGRCVVAVVGAAHSKGMAEEWARLTATAAAPPTTTAAGSVTGTATGTTTGITTVGAGGAGAMVFNATGLPLRCVLRALSLSLSALYA